jgi:hypothetical protein
MTKFPIRNPTAINNPLQVIYMTQQAPAIYPVSLVQFQLP